MSLDHQVGLRAAYQVRFRVRQGGVCRERGRMQHRPQDSSTCKEESGG